MTLLTLWHCYSAVFVFLTLFVFSQKNFFFLFRLVRIFQLYLFFKMPIHSFTVIFWFSTSCFVHRTLIFIVSFVCLTVFFPFWFLMAGVGQLIWALSLCSSSENCLCFTPRFYVFFAFSFVLGLFSNMPLAFFFFFPFRAVNFHVCKFPVFLLTLFFLFFVVFFFCFCFSSFSLVISQSSKMSPLKAVKFLPFSWHTGDTIYLSSGRRLPCCWWWNVTVCLLGPRGLPNCFRQLFPYWLLARMRCLLWAIGVLKFRNPKPCAAVSP